MLGHNILFEYCRTVKDSLPCSKIRDCWFEKIPVNDYLNECYSKEEIEKVLAPPRQKVVTLLELIEKAKRK